MSSVLATDLARSSEPLTCLRIPPSNMGAEQALLGALLANNKAFDRVAEFLQAQHFADPIHGLIFEAICRRLNVGQVADPITLRADFENAGTLEEVGGVPYLAQLLSAMVGIINAGDYGRAIHDAWLRRELIDCCVEAIDRAYQPNGIAGQDVLEYLDGAITRIADGAGDSSPLVPAGAAVLDAIVLSQEAGERESALAGITTGIASIDRMTGGLMPGQMYLVGARPAMGKSGLGLTIAARAASNRLKTLFWSGEMAAAQLGTRLAAAHAGLDVASVFRGKGWEVVDSPEGHKHIPRRLSNAEWSKLMAAQSDATKLPLFFDDRSGANVASLRARARRMKRGKGLDLLVVDYVGLLRGTPQGEKMKLYERMTEISRDLKLLAAELKIPLLVMAQLSRANEARENKMPQLSDLRDTGALEQDAYCVMFIHRPHYYLMQAGEPVRSGKEAAEAFQDRANVWHEQVASSRNLALLSVAKNRNGPTGMCRLRFNAETIWFRDDAESENSDAWGGDLLETV